MHIPSRIIICPLRLAITSASFSLKLKPLYGFTSTLPIDISQKFSHYSSVTVMEERIMPIQQG